MGQFEDMQAFVRIVDAGGIGKAAEQLGMAKSGVSRRLVALESRLGTTLLNRTTRRSSLTDTGREYYERAVKLISDVSELNQLAASGHHSLEGLLRLAAPLSFGLSHLTGAIDEFAREHPGLSVNIDFSDRQVDLVEQGVDLAIRISALKDSSLKARHLCPIHLVLCASPNYIHKHGDPSHPDDLKHHQVLDYTLGTGHTIRLTDSAGTQFTVQTSSRLAANNGDFLHEMALSHHGIAILPTFICWQSLATQKLLPVLGAYDLPPLDAWAVYPQTRYLSQRTRRLIDFLAQRFGDKPYWDNF